MIALAAVGTAAAASATAGLATDHHVLPAGTAAWEESVERSTPCSLPVANAHVQPGDTVYLLAGTYGTEMSTKRG